MLLQIFLNVHNIPPDVKCCNLMSVQRNIRMNRNLVFRKQQTQNRKRKRWQSAHISNTMLRVRYHDVMRIVVIYSLFEYTESDTMGSDSISGLWHYMESETQLRYVYIQYIMHICEMHVFLL